MPLDHLFDAELACHAGVAPLAEHGEGQLIGSGDGSVDGQPGAGGRLLDAVPLENGIRLGSLHGGAQDPGAVCLEDGVEGLGEV
jgi:hypothetical protein